MKIAIDIDEAALRQAAADLSQSADLLGDLSTNPKGVLGKLGITIDDDTAKQIADRATARSKLAASPAGAAAAIIHIDT